MYDERISFGFKIVIILCNLLIVFSLLFYAVDQSQTDDSGYEVSVQEDETGKTDIEEEYTIEETSETPEEQLEDEQASDVMAEETEDEALPFLPAFLLWISPAFLLGIPLLCWKYLSFDRKQEKQRENESDAALCLPDNGGVKTVDDFLYEEDDDSEYEPNYTAFSVGTSKPGKTSALEDAGKLDKYKRTLNTQINSINSLLSGIRNPNVIYSVKSALKVLQEIHDNVESRDLNFRSVKGLTNIYLPAYIKLMERYQFLENAPSIVKQNAQSTYTAVENSLREGREIFENILKDVVSNDFLDIESEASVFLQKARMDGLKEMEYEKL